MDSKSEIRSEVFRSTQSIIGHSKTYLVILIVDRSGLYYIIHEPGSLLEPILPCRTAYLRLKVVCYCISYTVFSHLKGLVTNSSKIHEGFL